MIKIVKANKLYLNSLLVSIVNHVSPGSYYITGDEWGMKKGPKYEWSAGKQI